MNYIISINVAAALLLISNPSFSADIPENYLATTPKEIVCDHVLPQLDRPALALYASTSKANALMVEGFKEKHHMGKIILFSFPTHEEMFDIITAQNINKHTQFQFNNHTWTGYCTLVIGSSVSQETSLVYLKPITVHVTGVKNSLMISCAYAGETKNLDNTTAGYIIFMIHRHIANLARPAKLNTLLAYGATDIHKINFIFKYEDTEVRVMGDYREAQDLYTPLPEGVSGDLQFSIEQEYPSLHPDQHDKN